MTRSSPPPTANPGMYTLYRDKDGHILAELGRNYGKQKVSSPTPSRVAFRPLACSTGTCTPTGSGSASDLHSFSPTSRRGHRRCPVTKWSWSASTPTGSSSTSRSSPWDLAADRSSILSNLLVDRASSFFGGALRGSNTKLAKTVKAKSFPSNVELAFEMPLSSGQFGTIYYSIAEIPENTGYKPREADERIGYFVTGHSDIGDPAAETPRRYINRWHLQKADPSLQMSPPKEPIIFYVEHTTPVRYRRWVRDGILEWNKAFEKIGIVNAIEVYQQDEATGAHMEKDPEDARYNFILWTNRAWASIGPSRVHPKTGQILDADIVMDEGFISGWIRQWDSLIPQAAMENFGTETLEWLETRPDYDPRIRLADPSSAGSRVPTRHGAGQVQGREPSAMVTDPTLLGDEQYDGLVHRVSQINGACQHCAVKAMDMAFIRLNPELISSLAQDGRRGKRQGQKEEG